MHAVLLPVRGSGCARLYTIDYAEAAIAYTVFVYGHIQGVGVTAYRIYIL